MPDLTSSIVLNANQRRHFEVLFARLEDSLTRIDALLGEPSRRHVLSIEEQDIPDSFRQHARPIVDGLRKQVSQFAKILDLKPRRHSRARSVAATLSSEAIRLEDSLSSQLRGYGEVDPSVAEHLDPALKEMARTLGALSAALQDHSHSASKR